MSGPHPTISAWERDEEEGHYTAEMHGWNLTVSWTPNDGVVRGFFRWSAEVGERKTEDEERFEEMQLAMAAAEAYAATTSPEEEEEEAPKSEGEDGGPDDDDDANDEDADDGDEEDK
ncbi:MAG: hypothetical protein AAF928_06405 [Myxococcota bacterium]